MNIPNVIESTNLSTAWCNTIQHIIDHKGIEISPMVLTITQFDESEPVRNLIDADLKNHMHDSIETVSSTIFPIALYMRYKSNPSTFYERYMRILPRIKKN